MAEFNEIATLEGTTPTDSAPEYAPHIGRFQAGRIAMFRATRLSGSSGLTDQARTNPDKIDTVEELTEAAPDFEHEGPSDWRWGGVMLPLNWTRSGATYGLASILPIPTGDNRSYSTRPQVELTFSLTDDIDWTRVLSIQNDVDADEESPFLDAGGERLPDAWTGLTRDPTAYFGAWCDWGALPAPAGIAGNMQLADVPVSIRYRDNPSLPWEYVHRAAAFVPKPPRDFWCRSEPVDVDLDSVVVTAQGVARPETTVQVNLVTSQLDLAKAAEAGGVVRFRNERWRIGSVNTDRVLREATIRAVRVPTD